MGSLDPITREIIKNALAAAGDEMAITMHRTAYSTVVRDCLDYSTQITDEKGEMIAQGVTIPLHIGSAPFAMKTFFEKFGNNIEPEDVFILNDPFEGGMHTPDIFIVKPIYWEGERVAFSLVTAHHLDVGGRLPGSGACDNTEIYQDGLRIPWLKLYRRGEPDESLFAILKANIRVPHMTIGDIRAQVAACNIGERHIHDIIRRYGVETFRECVQWLFAYTERILRDEIATWPDGDYPFTDYLDSDGVGGPRVKIQVTLKVRGDSLEADFTGTDPQVPGALNCTMSYVASTTTACIRSVMGADVPNNAGMFRPLTFHAPVGTILNVLMPGASSMRGVTGFRMADAVFGALSQILPDRVMAAGEGGNSLVIIGGLHQDRSPYVYFELLTGSWGGRPDRDGCDGLCHPLNVASNIPVEEAECAYPIRIDHYGLANDSGGPGKFRGGLAIEREWRLLHGKSNLSIRSDRRNHPPYGLYGGMTGKPSTNLLTHPDGTHEVLPGFFAGSMAAGDHLFHRMPGAGGWGDPLERDPHAVLDDVKNDKVSIASAHENYGVMIDAKTLSLDEVGTLALRQHRRELAKEASSCLLTS